MADEHAQDPDLDIVERIYDALDDGNPEQAFSLARGALELDREDPVVHLLAGRALLALGRPRQAADLLARAVELDPDDPEFRVVLAEALYRCCRFSEAEVEAGKALEGDARAPDCHYMQALLLERSGRYDESDHHFERAAELDPDTYSKPVRISSEQFEKQVLRAREMLDEEMTRILDDVVVTIEQLPSDEILLDETPPLDPELLGLFVGVPLTARSSFSPGGELPPRILLFKRTLERACADLEELAEEIGKTLHHELGHYVGKEEEEFEELDLL